MLNYSFVCLLYSRSPYYFYHYTSNSTKKSKKERYPPLNRQIYAYIIVRSSSGAQPRSRPHLCENIGIQ